MPSNIVVAITGASGATYSRRLVDVLLAAGCDVHLIISEAGQAVLRQELVAQPCSPGAVGATGSSNTTLGATAGSSSSADNTVGQANRGARQSTSASGVNVDPEAFDASVLGLHGDLTRLHYHDYRDYLSPVASGSFSTDGMAVCPCSSSSLGAIANGVGTNLIHRAAEVHLKERRKLILVTRETPLSLVQIENMRRATEAGAVILPASPAFYHGVESVAQLVDFIVARILDQLRVDHKLVRPWGSE